MFKELLSNELERVDALGGNRKELLELADLAIERALNHHFDKLFDLWTILPDKNNWENTDALISHMKASCISWYLQGEIPQELTLLEGEDLDKIVNYAKFDFETESRGYLVDLEYQKRKLFWSEQG
jgi:hypothetical protein